VKALLLAHQLVKKIQTPGVKTLSMGICMPGQVKGTACGLATKQLGFEVVFADHPYQRMLLEVRELVHVALDVAVPAAEYGPLDIPVDHLRLR
jgi:hypothetical protein